MRIDPALLPILAGYDPGDGTDVEAERNAGAAAARAMTGWLTRPAPASVDVRDVQVPPITLRVYSPGGTGLRGGLVFAHGGGWATGSIDTAHEHCAALAADACVIVVSVGYRLVPEHPFPAGLDDVTLAVDRVTSRPHEFGIDPARLAIGGESAGANLAAAPAARRREVLALQLLEAPVLDLTDTPAAARAEVARDFPALDTMMRVAHRRYRDAGADPQDPVVSPILSKDLAGLPPAALLVADV